MSQPQTSQAKVLLFVGEGNFTFTNTFVDKFQPEKSGYLVIATDFSTQYQTGSQEIFKKLRERGVKIIEKGVDATELHQLKEGKGPLQEYKDACFPRIQFNCPFPTSASYTENNEFQRLLFNFFLSCSYLQQPGDRIHVVLVDSEFYEKWSDVGGAAKRFNYILKCTRAFDDKIYPGYVHAKKAENKTHNKKKEFVFQLHWRDKDHTGNDFFVKKYQPLPIIPITEERFDEEKVIEGQSELIINENSINQEGSSEGSSSSTNNSVIIASQDNQNTETITNQVSNNNDIVIEKLSQLLEKMKSEPISEQFLKDALNLFEKHNL